MIENKKFALALATLFLVFKLIAGQQCRYVIEPDCSSSDDATMVQNGGFFGRSTKGEKGERGYSGKLGPKGNRGQKGMKGDTARSVEELTRRVDGKCFAGDWFYISCQFKKTQITMQICTVKAAKTMHNFKGHFLGTPYYDVFNAHLLSSVIFFFFFKLSVKLTCTHPIHSDQS